MTRPIGADLSQWLDKNEASDHAEALVAAGLQLLPLFGGSLASLFAEYVPRRKHQRLVAFLSDLGHRLEDVEKQIDQEFVRSTEFKGMVEDVFERTQERKNEDKLSYWARLLAGMATNKRPPSLSDRERMVDTLNSLRLSHLHLLHVVATTHAGRDDDGYAGNVTQTLTRKIPGVPPEELRRDWNDLARAELLATFPSGIMTARGAAELAGFVTPYGRLFIDLIDVEAASTPAP